MDKIQKTCPNDLCSILFCKNKKLNVFFASHCISSQRINTAMPYKYQSLPFVWSRTLQGCFETLKNTATFLALSKWIFYFNSLKISILFEFWIWLLVLLMPLEEKSYRVPCTLIEYPFYFLQRLGFNIHLAWLYA